MSVRKDRVSQQLQEEIASIIQFELKDPGLGFVTITKVELSNDLSYAKVNFSCLGPPGERERTQETLDRAAGFIRSLVRRRLRLKIIPELVFVFDHSVEGAIDMAAKLDRLKEPPLDAESPDAQVPES